MLNHITLNLGKQNRKLYILVSVNQTCKIRITYLGIIKSWIMNKHLGIWHCFLQLQWILWLLSRSRSKHSCRYEFWSFGASSLTLKQFIYKKTMWTYLSTFISGCGNDMGKQIHMWQGHKLSRSFWNVVWYYSSLHFIYLQTTTHGLGIFWLLVIQDEQN